MIYFTAECRVGDKLQKIDTGQICKNFFDQHLTKLKLLN